MPQGSSILLRQWQHTHNAVLKQSLELCCPTRTYEDEKLLETEKQVHSNGKKHNPKFKAPGDAICKNCLKLLLHYC